LAHHNHSISVVPAPSDLRVKDLYGTAIYQILDAVPVLKIPSTLGWDNPVPDPGAWGGVVLLALKLVVIVALASLFARLWAAARVMRKRVRDQDMTDITDEASVESCVD